jgi:hypothetical protein
MQDCNAESKKKGRALLPAAAPHLYLCATYLVYGVENPAGLKQPDP